MDPANNDWDTGDLNLLHVLLQLGYWHRSATDQHVVRFCANVLAEALIFVQDTNFRSSSIASMWAPLCLPDAILACPDDTSVFFPSSGFLFPLSGECFYSVCLSFVRNTLSSQAVSACFPAHKKGLFLYLKRLPLEVEVLLLPHLPFRTACHGISLNLFTAWRLASLFSTSLPFSTLNSTISCPHRQACH